MIYSDSLYNISLNYNGGFGGEKNYGAEINDSKSYIEYHKFISDSLNAGLKVSKKDTHVYYYCDQIYIGLIQDVYRKSGIENKRVAL
jgi:hypothetical protein